MITSIKNDRVRLARALQQRAKARRKEGKIVLEGTRLLRDAVACGYVPDFVLCTPDAADEALLEFLRANHIEPLPVSEDVMRLVSDTGTPQEVVGVFPLPAPRIPQPLRRVLILDAVGNPGNMGTLLRTAAAAGVEAALLAPRCADPYHPKALRGGMGAHFRVAVVEASWPRIAAVCANLMIFLADSHATTRYDEVDWPGAWALIVGSEAHGAGAAARELAHKRLSIPMAAETESLNAAVAAGVLLFEAQKHRPR